MRKAVKQALFFLLAGVLVDICGCTSSNITNHQSVPTITWATPTAITYGTALSSTQLDAAATIPGTFSYSPAVGTVLTAGSQTLTATFTPTDSTNYKTATATVTLTVNQASPTVTWATPAAITYGTALSSTQLDAAATVPGTFSYSPAVGTVLAAGSQTLTATFTPTDSTNYKTATATVILTVNQASPTVTWATPAAITYGTALSSTQLDAAATIPGSFSYSPAAGTVLATGSHTLTAIFTPTDAVDYKSTTATVVLAINLTQLTITWNTPAPITYGTALSSTQLDATSNIPGTFSYSPASGTVLPAGSQTLMATFTPTDTANYNSTTASVTLTVNQALVTITWATPAAITCGSPLSSVQLDAVASVSGSFVYSPPAGTTLSDGQHTLTATFTPTSSNYAPATATVIVTVSGSGTSASFADYKYHAWQGTWDFSGNTLVITGSAFNNSCSLIYNTAAEPVSTSSLNYEAVGLLSLDNGITINNNADGTIQAIATGDAGTNTAGIWAETDAVINNSGLIDAEVLSTDGSSMGISIYNGGTPVKITNNVGGTISATAPYAPQGIEMNWTGSQTLYNYGTIMATSTGATNDSNTSGLSSNPTTIGSFIDQTNAPMYIENDGSIVTDAHGAGSDWSRTIGAWSNFSETTVVNNGTVFGQDTIQANGVYFGSNGYDVTFKNTGSWISYSGNGSKGKDINESVWLENDGAAAGSTGTTGVMTFVNSGVIATNDSFAVAIASYSGAPWDTTYFTNTGTIVGGWLGIGWPGDVYFNDSGDIHTVLTWIGATNSTAPYSNAHVVITGLPTIDPVLSASSNGANTLELNLTGTLQYVNGKAASGTSLAAYNPGTSGSIVVSGKTYRWSNFGTVTGTFTPPATLAAGPTGLNGTVTSNTTANLGWNQVSGATGYNLKRATTSTGPYTTIASNITSASYTDSAAYASVDDYYYVVSALVNNVETANSAEIALHHVKVTGTVIGTASSAKSSNVVANVFDSDLDTYFEGPDASGDWVGLDFGANSGYVIQRISYSPRPSYESRMVGGVVQGANSADFSDAVTLFTISNQPLAGLLTSANLTNTTSYRYLRYVGPVNSYCDVAELQFYIR
jgi:hypothetical protein